MPSNHVADVEIRAPASTCAAVTLPFRIHSPANISAAPNWRCRWFIQYTSNYKLFRKKYHTGILYYYKQNWYKDASIFRPPACLVLIRRCGAQQSHTCPQRRHVRQKGGERYGAFLRLGRSRGRCPRPLVGFSAWRRGTRGHATAARQRRRQASPPKRRTGPSALPPRRRAACPQQRR